MSGLIYQVVWMRMLIRSFGISLYAVSIVVAVFMGGLSLGSFLVGHVVSDNKVSLKLYSYLEAAIAMTAVVASVFGTDGTGLKSWRPLAAAGPAPFVASAIISRTIPMRLFLNIVFFVSC